MKKLKALTERMYQGSTWLDLSIISFLGFLEQAVDQMIMLKSPKEGQEHATGLGWFMFAMFTLGVGCFSWGAKDAFTLFWGGTLAVGISFKSAIALFHMSASHGWKHRVKEEKYYYKGIHISLYVIIILFFIPVGIGGLIASMNLVIPAPLAVGFFTIVLIAVPSSIFYWIAEGCYEYYESPPRVES